MPSPRLPLLPSPIIASVLAFLSIVLPLLSRSSSRLETSPERIPSRTASFNSSIINSLTLRSSRCLLEFSFTFSISCSSLVSFSWYSEHRICKSATDFCKDASPLRYSCSRSIRACRLLCSFSSSCCMILSFSDICTIDCLHSSPTSSNSLFAASKSLSNFLIVSPCSCNDCNCCCKRFSLLVNSISASSQFLATSVFFKVRALTSPSNVLIFSSRAALTSITEAIFNFSSLKSLTCFSNTAILIFSWFFSSSILSRFSLTVWSSTSFCAWWAFNKVEK